MKKYGITNNIVEFLLVRVFYGVILVAIGLVAWRVLEYTFTSGDIVVLLFLVVFFMSLKYD